MASKTAAEADPGKSAAEDDVQVHQEHAAGGGGEGAADGDQAAQQKPASDGTLKEPNDKSSCPLNPLIPSPNDKGEKEEEQEEEERPRTSIAQRYRQQYTGEKLFLTAGARRIHGRTTTYELLRPAKVDGIEGMVIKKLVCGEDHVMLQTDYSEEVLAALIDHCNYFHSAKS
ncbi:hypothetical protein T484DRAFT_1753615 [Baffinella frigidus]|nr:hypothetical protein T484DRAFT_1753615 [Cryptophyta sp. CCMP2293]